MSSSSVNPPGPTRDRLGFWTILWALIPVLSLGMLAPVPFAHAAARLKQPRLWAVTAVYCIGVVALFVFAETAEGSWGEVVFGGVLAALTIVGTIHAFLLRRRVFTPWRTQPAVTAALAARRLREEARAITIRDPDLARQLRIGRPDLPRQFDDGGLVDVNHVPAGVLVDRLGLSPAQAGAVVETRERLSGFSGPEECTAFSGVPEATVNALRDWLLFLPGGVGGPAQPMPDPVPVDRGALEPDRPPVDDRGGRSGTRAHQRGNAPPPPGWYPDPGGSRGLRYWDGSRWFDRVIPPPQ